LLLRRTLGDDHVAASAYPTEELARSLVVWSKGIHVDLGVHRLAIAQSARAHGLRQAVAAEDSRKDDGYGCRRGVRCLPPPGSTSCRNKRRVKPCGRCEQQEGIGGKEIPGTAPFGECAGNGHVHRYGCETHAGVMVLRLGSAKRQPKEHAAKHNYQDRELLE